MRNRFVAELENDLLTNVLLLQNELTPSKQAPDCAPFDVVMTLYSTRMLPTARSRFSFRLFHDYILDAIHVRFRLEHETCAELQLARVPADLRDRTRAGVDGPSGCCSAAKDTPTRVVEVCMVEDVESISSQFDACTFA